MCILVYSLLCVCSEKETSRKKTASEPQAQQRGAGRGKLADPPAHSELCVEYSDKVSNTCCEVGQELCSALLSRVWLHSPSLNPSPAFGLRFVERSGVELSAKRGKVCFCGYVFYVLCAACVGVVGAPGGADRMCVSTLCPTLQCATE
eukprot:RCo017072